ncbi:DUF924 domain-containing protein [Palleronia sediminis]|uniref:DUF924 domain-containing protein n=1 Tax=Palleronia sediminis TaxID=2547833 RepID=A0A4R6AJK3_9RHOB|nr:DUF924 family protein [Palleronia sediminis]TDL84160.1 DUF924 domain-containing protein [Palleronia sediminis]
MSTPDEVLGFWLDEVGPSGWYNGSEALDAEIRDRFLGDWEALRAGGLSLWLTASRSALAYIIVADQFPRNMFRDDPRAFALDAMALSAAKVAISRRWDLRIAEPERQFFYLPLMHSENLCDQDRCVRLMSMRMPETGAENLLHARAHREVIRRFGRFPHRNAALDRPMQRAERVFLNAGGYGALLRDMKADA